MEWIRRWVRRNTRPIPRHAARRNYNRLSVAYYMFAWTAAGVAFFQMLTVDITALPDELNVHADPNSKTKPSIYRKVESVRQSAEEDTEVRIVNIRNLSFGSTERYKAKTLNKQAQDTNARTEEDFFGGTENSPDEELDLSV